MAYSRIVSLLNIRREKTADNDLETRVTAVLHNMGVPAHIKGYHYLREAIILSIKDSEMINSVTKLLYPDIAKEYKTTGQKVERAIRNAIEVSWQRGNMDAMERIFGFSAHTGKGRPTNSEYIARLADELQLLEELVKEHVLTENNALRLREYLLHL